MANLIITARCNLDCLYCFARAALKNYKRHHSDIKLRDFQRKLHFLDRSGIDEVRMLGGEPTLHPAFPALVDRSLAHGMRLRVFSNGLMPEVSIRHLEQTPISQVAVLINVIPPENRQSRERDQQVATLRRLGQRVILGLNIDTPIVQCDYLLDFIQNFGLSPYIRFGLAHPCADGSNRFLHPRYYPEVGRQLIGFATKAKEKGVGLSFDCGFVPCMFPSGSLETLGQDAANIGRQCNPVLDILPDGRVFSCFPLAAIHHETLPRRRDAAWLRARFEAVLKPWRSLGLFRECVNCQFKNNGNCMG